MTSDDMTERIRLLEEYRNDLLAWRSSESSSLRAAINQRTVAARREVIEAGCFRTATVGPPPIVGGFVMKDLDPFDMMLEPPYGVDLLSVVVDMLDQTIGALKSAEPQALSQAQATLQVEMAVQRDYVFIAMPMNNEDPQLVDVLDAIKEGASRCGLVAERVDEPASNERITDRILESIRKAEYVVVDLTDSRPNVCYEAGYAQGLGKTPIYIAKKGTRLEFDLKDYPVIFFENMKALKDGLETRLRGLAEGSTTSGRGLPSDTLGG